MLFTLEKTYVITFMLSFFRLGTVCMFLPGLSDSTTPARMRLFAALTLTHCFALNNINLKDYIAQYIEYIEANFFAILVHELAIGLLLGYIVRTCISSLHMAGTAIASSLGLSNAALIDPMQQSQSLVLAQFLQICFVFLLFKIGFHHLIWITVAQSYAKLGILGFFNQLNTPNIINRTLEVAYDFAITLAMPFLGLNLIFQLGSGILAKLVPQIQVFFILMPVQLLLGFILLYASFNEIMLFGSQSLYTLIQKALLYAINPP